VPKFLWNNQELKQIASPNIESHKDSSRRPCLPKAREVGGDLDYAAEQKSSIPAILAVGFHRVIGICSEALLGT